MDRAPHSHHAGCGCDPKEIQRYLNIRAHLLRPRTLTSQLSGNEYSLFKHIDVERVRCLNEAAPKTGSRVFRPYDFRHDNTKVRGCANVPH